MHGKEALVLDQSFRKQPIRRKTYSIKCLYSRSIEEIFIYFQRTPTQPLDQFFGKRIYRPKSLMSYMSHYLKQNILRILHPIAFVRQV